MEPLETVERSAYTKEDSTSSSKQHDNNLDDTNEELKQSST
jgi:hypothetical protein